MSQTNTKRDFIPGLNLCEQFYWKTVRPILDEHFPELPHTAALIGDGSEVLGFDDEMSTDHHWGPRVLIFLHKLDHHQYVSAIQEALANKLPYQFQGYPTNFSKPNPDDSGDQLLQTIDSGPVNHRVSTHTTRGFFSTHLGFDIEDQLQPADWLTFSEQRLLSVSTGAVYHDDIGLCTVQTRFAYYPHDVWLYLLASGWARIGQEEHLMGRAGLNDDEVGSALIGARLVRDIMHLCFLMEKTYAPYPKWFGTAFKRLSCADDLWPVLQHTLKAETWQARDRYLAEAYENIAAMHNALNLTNPMPEQTISFHGRPFQVIGLHGFADALVQQIQDPVVRQIAQHPLIGGIDQFSDSTDLLSNPIWRPVLKQLYQ